MRLLVLNCFSRNALAVIRALEGKHELYGAATGDGTRSFDLPAMFRTRALRKVLRYASPESDAFLDDLVRLSRAHRIDGVIGTGTTSTNALSRCKHALESATSTKALVEPWEKLERLSDKWCTYQLARQIGVPMPRTELLSGREVSPFESWNFPLIVKPRLSFAAIGVRKYADADSLAAALRAMTPEELDGNLIVQEALTGELHDVTSCSHRGTPTALLTQQRLVSLYDFGGGGIVNRTTDEPELAALACKVLSAVEWNGIAMFDFLRTTDGKFHLLECNPKFWGTTELTIRAGNNVAEQLVELYLEAKVPTVPPPYERGLVFKWIFPDCVFSWFQRPRTLRAIGRRIAKTFRRYEGSRTLTNLRLGDLPHLLGIVLDRTTA